MRIKWLKVNNERNSRCCSAKLSELDWTSFATDNTFAPFYLHIPHITDDTVHRVFPKDKKVNEIAMKRGVLYWIVNQ